MERGIENIFSSRWVYQTENNDQKISLNGYNEKKCHYRFVHWTDNHWHARRDNIWDSVQKKIRWNEVNGDKKWGLNGMKKT